MKSVYFPSLLAAMFLGVVCSCSSTSRDSAETMTKPESYDGTGPVGGPTTAGGPGAIGGGNNSGGSGSGAMSGAGMAAGATSYSSGR